MKEQLSFEELRKKKEELGKKIESANDNFREKLREQAKRGRKVI